MAIINLCLSLVAIKSLPSVVSQPGALKPWTRGLIKDIDWLGAIIISVALGILLYVLSMTSSSYRRVSDPQNIALLIVSCILLAEFPCWMHYQVRKGKPVLIPNRYGRGLLSRRSVFQRVEGLSAPQSSIRFLASVVMGAVVNLATAFLISRVKVRTLGVVSALIAMIAQIPMATVEVGRNYWLRPFSTIALLFTVSNLVISDAFPADIQSLAGGVFNEVSQFGNSVGLAVTASIAASVTEHSGLTEHRAALMEGYRGLLLDNFCGYGYRRYHFILRAEERWQSGKKDD
ncbi:hypothetical protein ACJ73_01032 [Blastomyces percursus]|uniref:Major facilitator superfamily (MFS) profile domain-containing protein n=1 Tax=Blastomyces percursus TaxID=1658174 RepID=A0A1J9QFG3_9EURO|nr:hypothetical protein ACJ73_01032 [Blastomyces percursus]